MKTSPPFFKTVLIAILIFSANQAFPQGKFEVSAGYGVPELLNIGIKYGQNTQIGAYWGFYSFGWYGSTVMDWSCGIKIIYHFTGKSKYVEQAPWYISGGLAYHDLGVMNRYEEYDISVCPRLGRTINFSKKLGMNADIGLFLPLSMTPDYDSYDFIVLPSGSLSFFVRF